MQGFEIAMLRRRPAPLILNGTDLRGELWASKLGQPMTFLSGLVKGVPKYAGGENVAWWLFPDRHASDLLGPAYSEP